MHTAPDCNSCSWINSSAAVNLNRNFLYDNNNVHRQFSSHDWVSPYAYVISLLTSSAMHTWTYNTSYFIWVGAAAEWGSRLHVNILNFFTNHFCQRNYYYYYYFSSYTQIIGAKGARVVCWQERERGQGKYVIKNVICVSNVDFM